MILYCKEVFMERDLSQLTIDPARRERTGPGRRFLVLVLLAGALAIAVIAAIVFSRRAPEVDTATVREAGAAQTAVLNASGYVTPRRRATVSAKVTGKIREVFIDEGMRVAAGQVLARLDDIDAVAALHASEAENIGRRRDPRGAACAARERPARLRAQQGSPRARSREPGIAR